MLVITGIGRTGTSVLALWLRNCGIPINGAWIGAHEAGIEDVQASSLNESIDAGLSDDDAIRTIKEVRATVLKDPRFTMNATRKIRLWACGQPNMKVILTHRNPSDAVASRARRELFYWDSPLHAQLAFAETVMALEQNEVPWRLLMFPQFLMEFPAVFAIFQAMLGGAMPSADVARDAWEATIDLDCVHEFARVDEQPLPLPYTGNRWTAGDFIYAR